MTTITPKTIGGRRHYTIDGNDYLSVTEILQEYKPKKENLADWKSRNPDWRTLRDRGGIRGSFVHHQILNPHAIRQLELPKIDMAMVDDDLIAEVETCMIMWDELNYEIEPAPYVEQTVWSHEHRYAGTFDLLTDGTIVDLKTSVGAFDSYKMQIAAYFHSVRNISDFPDPVDAEIIVLNPNPNTNPSLTADVVTLDEDEINHWFDEFTSLAETVHSQQRIA